MFYTPVLVVCSNDFIDFVVSLPVSYTIIIMIMRFISDKQCPYKINR